MSKKSKRRTTRDNFESVAARLGLDQDNMLAQSGYRAGRNITTSITELEDMYRTSWVVGRMVEVVAEDMVRACTDGRRAVGPGKRKNPHRPRRRALPGRGPGDGTQRTNR